MEELSKKYETIGKRILAILIDTLLFVPLYLIEYLVEDIENIVILVIALIFSYSLIYIYNIYFHYRTGKRLAKNG